MRMMPHTAPLHRSCQVQGQGKSRIRHITLHCACVVQYGTCTTIELYNIISLGKVCMIVRSCLWSNGQGLVYRLGLGRTCMHVYVQPRPPGLVISSWARDYTPQALSSEDGEGEGKGDLGARLILRQICMLRRLNPIVLQLLPVLVGSWAYTICSTRNVSDSERRQKRNVEMGSGKLTKQELTKWEVDKVGIDKVGS